MNIIFCGDININLLNNDNLTNNYVSLMSHYGFTLFINSSTRVWDGGKSCVDHIFIKTISNFNIANTVILESTITDHFPSFFQIIPNTISKNKSKKSVNESELYISFNKNTFESQIKKVQWQNMLYLTSSDKTIESYTNIIKNAAEKSYNDSTHKSIFKIKPWITTEILNSIRERDILHAQSRKKPYDLHLKEKLKKYRNYLNSTIKKAKFDFYGEKIKKCNNDPKLIWKTIKEATQGNPNT